MRERDPNDLLPLACVIDGEADSHVLQLYRVGEAHVVICRNCSLRLLYTLRTKPAQIWNPPDELERIGHALIAEADLFARLAQSRRDFGQMLIDRVCRESPEHTDPA